MYSLEGKVAIVTGAARGIGKGIALKFAQAGAKVMVCGQTEATVKQCAEEIVAAGGQAEGFQVNVAEASEVSQLVQKILDNQGQVDILVNNAGITRDGLLLRMSEDDWNDVLAVNLKGVFHLTKAVLKPMMKKRQGRIVNVSSVVGVMGNPGQANYAASKAGVIGFTKSVAKEVASRGITANVVAPGYIETDMTAQLSDDVQKLTLEHIPLKRFGTAENIADVAAFLASDAASYITGGVIQVDGGLAM